MTLAAKCVSGITANLERCRHYVQNSIGIVTALNPVIGYKTDRDGLSALLMASLEDGKLAFVGGVELGVTGGIGLLKELERLRRRRPVVPCGSNARWVEPKKFCTVRFHGWRPSGGWRDPVFGGWDEKTTRPMP